MLNSNNCYALRVALFLALICFSHIQDSGAADNVPGGEQAPQGMRQLSLAPRSELASEEDDFGNKVNPAGLQRYPLPPASVSSNRKAQSVRGDGDHRPSKGIANAENYETGVGDPEWGGAGGEPLVVLPEVTTPIKLSSSDVNRFVCTSGEINDVPISSEEKGVIIRYSGREAFVKFKVMKRSDGKLGYSTTPTEIFIVCGGNTYSVIARPSRIRSQTIRLGTGTENRVEQNRSLYEGLPFEKRVMRLIKEAYTDNLPDSYTVAKRNKIDNTWRGLTIILKREVDVDGEGLHLKEYHISSQPGHKGLIKLSEKMFLRKEFALNPLGVSIDKHKLEQSDVARLFIVEQKAEQPLGGNGLQFMTIDDAGGSAQPSSKTPQPSSGGNKPRVPSSSKPKTGMPQQPAEDM